MRLDCAKCSSNLRVFVLKSKGLESVVVKASYDYFLPTGGVNSGKLP
jgi:hypothetical protein